MNDDQMDELLIQGVRDYNAPGEIPREGMWRQIQQARLAQKAEGARAAIDARRSRWWLRPAVGIAAALILAAGIGIGSLWQRQASSSPTTIAQTPDKIVPAAGNSGRDTTNAAPTPDTNTVGVVRKLHEATKQTDAKVRAIAAATPVTGTSRESAPGNGGGPASQSLAYRLVVLQHLAGSEAMITSFRSSARNGALDAELKSWSRELLSTTRLLESSQASTDPVMKRLLGDLDLVLSQIVQYTNTGTANPEELDLIEQSINKRGVMSKLRSTIPSRNIPAGT